MRVLLVKLSSMGDLTHALPAITDAACAIPGISFDWVIDKSFSEIASWHPAVKNVITSSHRVWKKNLIKSFKSGELKKFVKSVRKEKYDLIIDGQTSLKSALIMSLARGLKCGLDKNSCREWIAHLFYKKQFCVDKELHAIQRLRSLFSQALGYTLSDTIPNYGISNKNFLAPNFDLPKNYIVCVHNASWKSKLWPKEYWRKLIDLAVADGFNVLLPWGNLLEKERATYIANKNGNAYVLPFCSLSEHAYILINAKGAICSDTGLSHLAASLNVPSLTLYGSTSEVLIGTTGSHQTHFVSPFKCKKCYNQTCLYEEKVHEDAVCQLSMSPEEVWRKFILLL
ncbi:lipopolysaccharide heptosyltransferase I [Gammaproteobacteria bacterium]|nr:lipopolysaccharide heptosyltransferase I [Gammaproteobacteria bacterium]